MARFVIIFEDHTAQQFRPLAWSVPVYEIPCGLFNLRERVQILIARDEESTGLGLMPRSLLTDLQRASLPTGIPVGPEACRAAAAEDVLFLSARIAPSWPNLVQLMNDMQPGEARADDYGLLAWRTGSAEADAAIASWSDWEAKASAAGAWTASSEQANPWEPGPAPVGEAPQALGYLWDLVHGIGEAIMDDVNAIALAGGGLAMPPRSIFGALPSGDDPVWMTAGRLDELDGELPVGVHLQGVGHLWLGEGVELSPGVVIDTRKGPVVLDRDVTVAPNVFLEGPIYLGCGTRVKAGATLYGETAVCAVGRVSGEIAESQICAFANKQHAGFLGHAVIGSWVNLGADTTNSDLKNNYGEITVNYGLGPVETGSMFVGLMTAEHVKSAIGTTFNTGTTVGFSGNIFAAGFPRSCLGNFTWGDGRGRRVYQVERAIEVAEVVMGRRGCRFTPDHSELFRRLAGEG